MESRFSFQPFNTQFSTWKTKHLENGAFLAFSLILFVGVVVVNGMHERPLWVHFLD